MHTLTPDTTTNRQSAFDSLVGDLDVHKSWYEAGIAAGQLRTWIHTGYVTTTARRLTKLPQLTFEGIPTTLTPDQIQALHSLIKKRIHKVQSRDA